MNSRVYKFPDKFSGALRRQLEAWGAEIAAAQRCPRCGTEMVWSPVVDDAGGYGEVLMCPHCGHEISI